MQTLLVNRTDPSDITLLKTDSAALDDGEVRLSIDSFALTANNVTYMIFGDQIGYWHYFNPKAYGFGEDHQGRMPVWGFATVTESRCDEVAVGTEVYGFLPVADELVVRPGKITPQGFQDVADHRAPLHPVYNGYSYTYADPSYGVQKAIQPVLRPLFLTSFLIDDFVASEDAFGAGRVVITSASSKTSLGTAYCMKQRGKVEVIGLTSLRNRDFVESTGYYDTVVTYDMIEGLDKAPTVIVDMAGNGALLRRLYDHLRDNVKYGCAVGKSHYEGDAAPKPDEGAPMKMFFAPDYAKMRIGEWGGAGFAQRLSERWIPFLNDAAEWMSVGEPAGVEAMLSAYKDLLNDTADPTQAALFTLKG
ncbi:DUF2855 family protein [Algimonas porphyrae]|uniref:DUF2855 family protein n=1 Tax=Algimonas porphyrae TaxID=1128113 RepID=A0ABQ5V1B8_9PROT|nr:DUF2855 family protein [Algimonas porphyrae]GLQ20435.1 hypothetical protein GCM10007854_13900 [Algimonas porphyrae]